MMNDISFNFSKFRELINNYGGVSKVAKDIGLDKSLVNRHYNGDKNRPLTSTYIGKYCTLFGVSPDCLFGLTDIESTNKSLRFVCEYTGLNEKSVSNLRKALEDKNKKHYLFDSDLYIFCGNTLDIINHFLSDYDLLSELADDVENWKDDVFGFFDCMNSYIDEYSEKIIQKEDIQEAVDRYAEIYNSYKQSKYDKYCLQEDIAAIFENFMSSYICTLDNLKYNLHVVSDCFERAAELGVKITEIAPDFPLFEDGETNGDN